MAVDKPNSLKKKVTINLVSGIIVAGILILYIVQSLVYTSLKSELRSRGDAIATSMEATAATLIYENDQVLLQQLIRSQKKFRTVSYVIISDDSNKVIADTFYKNIPPEIKNKNLYSSDDEDRLIQFRFQNTDMEVYEVVHPIESGVVGYIRIGMDKAYVDEEIQKTIFYILITITVSVILSLIGAFMLVESITQPIMYLTDTADKISMGDFGTPIIVKSKDEIAELGNAIERMRESLKAAIERLKKRQSMRI